MTDLLNIRFERQPTMVSRRVAGEVLLVPVTRRMGEEASLFTLDEVAAFLWDQMDGHHTGRDLIQALEANYAVESGQAEQDVRAFLDQLQSVEAIRPAPGAKGSG